MMCEKNSTKECFGCGECKQSEIFGECDCCCNPIYKGNCYYDFEGDTVCEDCGMDYLRNFIAIAW